MTAPTTIRTGARVYLRDGVAGEPGCVMGFDRKGKAEVIWPDLDLGRSTFHEVDRLIVAENVDVGPHSLEFDGVAA